MSTVTQEKTAKPLPQIGRGDVIYGVVAVLVCLLALVIRVSGIA